MSCEERTRRTFHKPLPSSKPYKGLSDQERRRRQLPTPALRAGPESLNQPAPSPLPPHGLQTYLWVGPRSGERRHLVSSVPVTGPPMPLAARPLGRKVGWLQFKRWALMQGSPWDFWKSPKSLNGRDLHCEPPSSSQILPDPTPAAPDSPEQGLEEWKPTGTRKGQ